MAITIIDVLLVANNNAEFKEYFFFPTEKSKQANGENK